MPNLSAIAGIVLASAFPAAVQDAAPAKKWTQEELEKVSAAIQHDIEEQRGAKFLRPVKVKVTDAKGFLEYAKKRQEKTETPERRTRDETIAKMLGLVPPDLDLEKAFESLLESQVGGFYEPGADTFYLMETFGGDIAKIILAHELTHALDDQLYDLDGNLKKLGQKSDAEFAYQAVVEGSGTSAMNRWTIGHLANIDKKALLASQDLGTKGLAEAPVFLWKPLIAAYLLGEGFLTRQAGMNIAMKPATAEDVQQAFQHPPRSSEQILHPAKYWDPKELDEPRSVEIDASKIGGGWKADGDDTLGELYLALATTPVDDRKPFDPKNPFAVMGLKYTNVAAEGWGGDRALLLEKGNARILWLVTAWDRPEDAEEFRAAAEDVLKKAPGAETFRRTVDRLDSGDVVVVRVTQGVEEKDVPKPTWKIGPKAAPEAGSGR
jgi:hypothetical protein